MQISQTREVIKVEQEKYFEEYPYIEDQGSWIWIIFVISLFLLLFILIGITFSLFNNTIHGEKTPLYDFVFNYSDVNGHGNGINIENANEMSDEIGKRLTGSANTFEFNVSGNTHNIMSKYIIALEENESSTIPSSDIKIYLSSVQGNIENPITQEIPICSELENIEIDGKTYKKLYTVSLPNSVSTFSQDYILRMWIREGATDFYGKTYSLKVNVLAEGIGD